MKIHIHAHTHAYVPLRLFAGNHLYGPYMYAYIQIYMRTRTPERIRGKSLVWSICMAAPKILRMYVYGI